MLHNRKQTGERVCATSWPKHRSRSAPSADQLLVENNGTVNISLRYQILRLLQFTPQLVAHILTTKLNKSRRNMVNTIYTI